MSELERSEPAVTSTGVGACSGESPGGDVPDCAATLEELELFLDGELQPGQFEAIRRHLDGCTDCLGAFDFHAELKTVIAEKCNNDAMPPGLLSRIERCFGADFDGDGVIG